MKYIKGLWILSLALWMNACRGDDSDGNFVDMDSDGIEDSKDDFIDMDSDGVNDVFIDMDSDGVPDNLCGEGDVEFGMEIPTVILLLDRSGSMEDPFGSTNRWDAVYETLFDADDGVVAQLESQVRFGMQLYTGNAPETCPDLIGVPAEMNNYEAMSAAYRDTRPDRDTPTGASLDAVVELLLDDTEAGRKIIVLATDGLPDSCEIPNPANRDESDITEGEAIAAAQNAYSNGVPVYVISVGDDVGDAHLSEMANAGQGFDLDDPDGAEYYMGLDPDSLAEAFQDIISGVRNCVLALDGEVVESLADQCQVTVDGEALEYEAENGWRLNTPGEIEVVGETCDAILDGTISNLSVACPCDAFARPV